MRFEEVFITAAVLIATTGSACPKPAPWPSRMAQSCMSYSREIARDVWLIPAREEIFDNLILIGFEVAIRPLEALLFGDAIHFVHTIC
jgi:hypothetical protein